MTREELKAHCKKQIKACEMWTRSQDEKSCNKIYEEHKLILELLEQEPFINKPCISSGVCEHDKNKVLDKIIAEFIEKDKNVKDTRSDRCCFFTTEEILDIIDKYKAESESK